GISLLVRYVYCGNCDDYGARRVVTGQFRHARYRNYGFSASSVRFQLRCGRGLLLNTSDLALNITGHNRHLLWRQLGQPDGGAEGAQVAQHALAAARPLRPADCPAMSDQRDVQVVADG